MDSLCVLLLGVTPISRARPRYASPVEAEDAADGHLLGVQRPSASHPTSLTEDEKLAQSLCAYLSAHPEGHEEGVGLLLFDVVAGATSKTLVQVFSDRIHGPEGAHLFRQILRSVASLRCGVLWELSRNVDFFIAANPGGLRVERVCGSFVDSWINVEITAFSWVCHLLSLQL